jgi:hypothetical protein
MGDEDVPQRRKMGKVPLWGKKRPKPMFLGPVTARFDQLTQRMLSKGLLGNPSSRPPTGNSRETMSDLGGQNGRRYNQNHPIQTQWYMCRPTS